MPAIRAGSGVPPNISETFFYTNKSTFKRIERRGYTISVCNSLAPE
jgi:hypothetical protein